MARPMSRAGCGSGRSAEAYRLAAVALRAGRGQPAPWAGVFNLAPRVGRYSRGQIAWVAGVAPSERFKVTGRS